MATHTQAVQVIVDKIAAGELTADELVRYAAANDLMANAAYWEAALAMMMQEGMDISTTAIDLARTKLEAATSTLNDSISSFNTKSKALDTISEVVNRQFTMTRTAQIVRSFIDYDYTQNPSFLGRQNQGVGMPLNFQYLDRSTGKLYSAYFRHYSNSGCYSLNVTYGYWLDGEFVIIYRHNYTGSDTNYSPLAFSNFNHLTTLIAFILPLAKSDDPDDIRISLVLGAANQHNISANRSPCTVISADANDENLNIYQKLNYSLDSSPAGGGTYHPLSGNMIHAAYNREAHRFHGYDSVQYWDAAVGLESTDPAFQYPAAEIQKVDKYIEFTGLNQVNLPLKGRFLFDQSLGVDPGGYKFRQIATKRTQIYYPRMNGVYGSNWWSYSPHSKNYDAQFFNDSANEYAFGSTAQAAIGGNLTGAANYRWSYLVGDAQHNVSVNQLLYTPDIAIEYTASSQMVRRFKGMHVSVIDEHYQTVASLYLPQLLPSVGNASATYSYMQSRNSIWMVQAVDTERGTALAWCVDADRAGNSYASYPVVYKF